MNAHALSHGKGRHRATCAAGAKDDSNSLLLDEEHLRRKSCSGEPDGQRHFI